MTTRLEALKALSLRYAKGNPGLVLFGTGARAFALGSQIVVLIIMSRMLPKAEFGDLMIVFTIYRLLNVAVGSGLGSVVLYHVGRSSGDHALDIRLMRSVMVVGAVIGIVLAIVAVLAAPHIAALFDKPGLESWLVSLSPMVLFGSLLQISAGSFDGRSEITRSIVLTELMPNLIRMVGFGLVALLSLGAGGISYVLWIAVALPWCADAMRLFTRSVRGFEPLKAWDMRYGAWLGIYPLAGQQLQGIDMLLVAALFSSDVAAEYSIASRLAALYPFLVQIVTRISTPKIGAIIRSGTIAELNASIHQLRINALFLTAALTGAIIGIAPIITTLSGDYHDALSIMVALAIPPLARSSFAGIEIVLRMRGHGSAIASVAISSAFILCLGSWLLYPYLGIYALPASMAISALVINTLTAMILHKGGVKIADFYVIVPVAAVGAILVGLIMLFPPLTAAFAASGCLLLLAGISFLKFHLPSRNR